MFEAKKTNGSEKSYARSRINLYLQSNPDSSLENIGYVPVQRYVISQNGDELITDGLNACTALGFEAQGKVFLAHFTMNVKSSIPTVLQSIKRVFDISSPQYSDIKLKIVLGAWEAQTDSLDSILLLLHQLKLLEKWVKQIQQYVRIHINEIAEIPIKRKEIYQILAMQNIKNKDIEYIATFIHKIKIKFINLPNFVLEKKEKMEQYVSTRELVPLDHGYIQSDPRLINNLEDVIVEINIIIEKYYKHLLPGQKASLFDRPKHATEVQNLQAEIEKIFETSYSEKDILTQLKTALFPFMGENPKGGSRLRNALHDIYNEINKQKLDLTTTKGI